MPNVRVHDASLMRRSVPHSQIAGQLACASYMSPHGAAALAVIISSQPAQVGGGLVYVHVYEYVHEHVYVGPAAPALEDTP